MDDKVIPETELTLQPSLACEGTRGAARLLPQEIVGTSAVFPSSIQTSSNPREEADSSPLLPTSLLIRDDAENHQENFSNDTMSDSSQAPNSSAIFNLSTTIVGAGIMAFPATLNVLGLPLGVLTILAMAWLTQVSLNLLVKVSAKHNCWSYSAVVSTILGGVAVRTLQILIILSCLGVCMAYLIIIADVFSGTVDMSGPHHQGLLQEWISVNSFLSSRFSVLVATCVALAPLVSLTRVDSLAPTSAISISLAVLFVVITVSVFFVKLLEDRIAFPPMLPNLSSTRAVFQLFSIVPVMSNAFVCHYNVHPIWSEMADRSVGNMRKVCHASISVCTAIYVSISVSAFLLFGSLTSSDVLVNFDRDLGVPNSHLINDIVRIGYAVHVLLVFPLIYFALRQSVCDFVGIEPTLLAEDPVRFYGLTAALMASIFVGATALPNIWIAFQFTGVVAAVSIAFIFPALLEICDVDSGEKDSEDGIVSKFMLGFAVVAFVAGIIGITSNFFL